MEKELFQLTGYDSGVNNWGSVGKNRKNIDVEKENTKKRVTYVSTSGKRKTTK